MAENLLKALLKGEIDSKDLFEWIGRENQQIDFNPFPCTVPEFASYFLNYVHENAPSYEIHNSQRQLTPRAIKCSDEGETDRKLPVRRRSILSDAKNENKILHAQTFPPLRIHSPDSKNLREFITPKSTKITSESNLDASYASPISPLYSRNLNTPKTRLQNNNFCLGDFLVQKKSSSSKKKAQRSLCDVASGAVSEKKCRRINPTNLNEKHFGGSPFNEGKNTFDFKSDIELPVVNRNEERSLLLREQAKIRDKIDETTRILNVKLHVTTKREIHPVPEKITFVTQLNTAIRMYVFLLGNRYILNLASEMIFLISLLSSRQYLDENLNDSDSDFEIIENIEKPQDLFRSSHNCVYFAIEALKSQMELLKCLDRTTLKLLTENERIKLFSREFSDEILEIYNRKSDRVDYIETIRTNVCFMSDTDNRENFPTDPSFHAFRKQRDLFYELLRIWEQNHDVSGWSFNIALGGKIRTLLNLHGDPVNLRHFARLFKMQLLATSRQIDNGDDISIDQSNSILTSLPNVNADKFNRLKTRLTTKQDRTDLNALPCFSGNQEFYKDFILASFNSYTFLSHLRDSLIAEIVQTENTDLLESDEVDARMRNSYFAQVKSLRICAKFLGFLESLPYKMDNKSISDKVVEADIAVRQWFKSSFDVKSLLENSIRAGRLIVTIPWICKYVAMLDYVTVRLPYFREVIKILFRIYKNRSCNIIYNRMLIKLSLGWLFELSHFPNDFNRFEISSESNLPTRKLRLDEMEIVDQTILYVFCPYLEGFRKLLMNNVSNGNIIKHITPLTAVNNTASVTERKLKNQLEEAFFNCQPVSVRKSVEFISERVASACVKYICNQIVPEYKNTSLEAARKTLEEFTRTIGNNEEIKLEEILKERIRDLSASYLKELESICKAETERLMDERIPISLHALLSVDELPQTKETCVNITKRLCSDRVQQWVNSHINLGLFNKFKTLHVEILKNLSETSRESKEKPAFQLPSGGRCIEHNPNSLNAVKIIEILRRLSINLIESQCIDNLHLKKLLTDIEKTLTERCDVNDQIASLTNRMLTDLMLLIITYKCEYFDENLPSFINHWKRFVKPNEDHFTTVICPRNIMSLAQSKDAPRSWKILSKFVIKLLEVKLLNCETFETQCVSVYQHEWDEVTLRYLSTFFLDVIDGCREKDPEFNRFPSLVSFVSSFCSEMEF